MKKIILSLVAVLSIATASAQEFSWGIKAGANLSTLGNYDNRDLYTIKAGFVGGVFAEIKTCDWFGISADILYSGQGAKLNDSKVDGDLYAELSYINVPILANFHVTKTIALKTGLQPGFLVGSQRVGPKTVFSRFDLAIPIAIEFQLNCGLLFDLRYNIGLLNIEKNSADKSYNSVLTLTAGWRF